MKRNSHIVESRHKTSLETYRAKVTKRVTDEWYSRFRDFLISTRLIAKPKQIWNADETGFSPGFKSINVIGPLKAK